MFFVRSGSTGTQALAPVLWLGDQSTSFDRLDGLPSVVPAALNVGLSGIPFVACDVAGYKSFTCRPSDRELFLRWAQVGAVLPVMRTHHGTHRASWAFDRDAETLDGYRRWARLHTALFPHLARYAADAARRGHPIVRHLFLLAPRDERAGRVDDQLAVGAELIAAPVLERGAESRAVYLPRGGWVDLWSGALHRGPVDLEVDAPLDRLPLFLAAGTALATLDGYCDTLDAAPVEGLATLADSDASLRITIADPRGASPPHDQTLADGTTVRVGWTNEEGSVGDLEGRVSTGRELDAVDDELLGFLLGGATPLACAEGRRLRVDLRRGGRAAGRIEIDGPRSRRYTIQAR